jgi:hypothetical protein
MSIKSIIDSLPEEKRAAAQADIDAALEAAETKGHNATGYDKRQHEKAEKALEAAKARVQSLESDLSAAGSSTDKVKVLQKQLDAAAAERDALVPFKADFEKRELVKLVNSRHRLADDYYLDRVIADNGIQLEQVEKDGKTVYQLNEAGAAAFDSWAENPENARRIVPADPRKGPVNPTGYKPTAPPASAGTPRIQDPVLQAQYNTLTPEQQVRVARDIQRQQNL